MNLIGKKKTPQEMTKEWTRSLKKEERQIQSQIRKAERENLKLKTELKKEAKNVNGDKKRIQVLRIMARGIIQHNKNIAHLYQTKTQIHSCILGIKEQEANIKLTQTMKQSAKITQAMGNLVKLPEIQKTTQTMQREMQKMGIIQEMVDDTFEALEDPDIDEQVDSEIDKVILEITNMNLEKIGRLNGKKLAKNREEENNEDEEEKNELVDMKNRLKALS